MGGGGGVPPGKGRSCSFSSCVSVSSQHILLSQLVRVSEATGRFGRFLYMQLIGSYGALTHDLDCLSPIDADLIILNTWMEQEPPWRGALLRRIYSGSHNKMEQSRGKCA